MNLNQQASQKSLQGLRAGSPYRKPTQVGWRKCAKVNGRKLLKELGKKVGVTSEYALPLLTFVRSYVGLTQNYTPNTAEIFSAV